jgi:transcription elongation factor Elf1
MKPIDVYCEWIDKCEEQNREGEENELQEPNPLPV